MIADNETSFGLRFVLRGIECDGFNRSSDGQLLIVCVRVEARDCDDTVIRTGGNVFAFAVNRYLIHGHHVRWQLLLSVDRIVDAVALMVDQMNRTPMRTQTNELKLETMMTNRI